MRASRPVLLISAAIALAGLGPVLAQQQPRPAQSPPAGGPGGAGPSSGGGGLPQIAPPAPYKAVPVTLPQNSTDPGFEAFRKQLFDIASHKDRAALATLIAPNFFQMGEQGDKADKKKKGIERLATAIDLDTPDGSGWEMLAAAAKDATLEPFEQRQGVMCSPATPDFDDKAFEQLLKSTHTDATEWGYPSGAQLEVRGASAPDAPVIDRLGAALVRIIPDAEDPAMSAPAAPATTLRIVTPNGKTGYVASEAVLPLTIDQLCYLRDASGWKIAGYVGND